MRAVFHLPVALALCLKMNLLILPSEAISNDYNAYNYDLTTPQFTPDGRLLQVEYASAAADRSSPLVAVAVNDTLILITMTANSTAQNRLIIWNDKIVIAPSGVLPDSVALLQVLGKQATKHFQTYRTKLESANQVAQIFGNACQTHAFGGGIRPYGSTMLVCGIPAGSSAYIDMVATDPSGAILYPREKKEPFSSSSAASVRWIVGGGSSSQRQLRKQLDQALQAQTKEESPASLSEVILSISKCLLQQENNQGKKPKRDPKELGLEVVLVSPTLGIHRLTQAQTHAIWGQIQK
jgi:20S proteasome alpha/beta subunit